MVPGSTNIDEAERLLDLDHDLPRGEYNTIGGLIMAELGRLPEPGDTVTLTLAVPPDVDDDSFRTLALTVTAVDHRVPDTVELRWTDTDLTAAHGGAVRAGSSATPPSRQEPAAARAEEGRS